MYKQVVKDIFESWCIYLVWEYLGKQYPHSSFKIVDA